MSLPDPGYVLKWEQFRFLSGAKEAVSMLNKKGYLVVIVTNQRGIGRGLMKESDLKEIHHNMLREFGEANAKIDDIFYCPHNIEDNCDCRKPKPGMIISAVKKWGIDLKASLLIGNSDSDMQAGRGAGCAVYKVDSNTSLLDLVKGLEG